MRIQKDLCTSLLLFFPMLCSAVEVQVSTYPDCVQPGDTYYVKVTFINDSEENYVFFDPPLFFGIVGTKRYALSRNEDVYEWLPLVGRYVHPDIRLNQKYLIPPKSQSTLLFLAFQFPSLEDLHSEFWENEMEALKNSPEGLDFDFQIVLQKLYRESQLSNPFSEEIDEEFNKLSSEERTQRLREASRNALMLLKTNVKIKLRLPNEMTLIEQWYHNTPESLWPKVVKHTGILPGCKEMGLSQWVAVGLGPEYKRSDNKWITVQGELYSPWQFIRLGNRYPSDPNAPETWQGWKELEESISPSTMRDEIRLTRILIQYCDTRDEKVLEELKEWFAGMNEVQRACMANSLVARESNNDALYFPSRDLSNVVREYVISAKPVVEVK